MSNTHHAMSTLLHRSRALLIRALLLAGIVQTAVPSGAALLHALAGEPQVAERSNEPRHTDDPRLYAAPKLAEVDEVEDRRARPKLCSAFVSSELPKCFWEESVRIRAEDRRNCRPPNSRS